MLQLASSYLERTGYRLPTKAEWECVCRLGTAARRYFGESTEPLAGYLWQIRKPKEPGLSLLAVDKLNDLGLSDMCGNNRAGSTTSFR